MKRLILCLAVSFLGCSEMNAPSASVPTPGELPAATGELPAATGELPAATGESPAATGEILPSASPHRFALKSVDGTYDFYIGKGVKEAADQKKPLPPGWYKLGNVKQSRVDRATIKSGKVATYSLEDVANNDMDIEFSKSEKESLKLKAGDPCLSGVVQVAIDPKSGSPTALFDVLHWVKYPNGPYAKNVYTTGVIPDEEWPTLRDPNTPPPDCR